MSDNVLLSCYFTSRPDPQSGKVRTMQPEAVKLWYESALAVGIDAIVLFHNGLPPIFGQLFPKMYMPYTELSDYEVGQTLSINDVRFAVFLTYLVERSQINYALITDAFDVEFYENPFQHMERDKLYIGSNDAWIDKPKQCPRLRALVRNKDISAYLDKPLLNPGIIGGDTVAVKAFIRDMLPRLGEQFNNNMPLANVVGYSDKWGDKLVTGFPLHTQFKKHEPRDCGAWIRHK